VNEYFTDGIVRVVEVGGGSGGFVVFQEAFVGVQVKFGVLLISPIDEVVGNKVAAGLDRWPEDEMSNNQFISLQALTSQLGIEILSYSR
jgi:hypothetical protein